MFIFEVIGIWVIKVFLFVRRLVEYEVWRYGVLGFELDFVVEGFVVIGWYFGSYCNKEE